MELTLTGFDAKNLAKRILKAASNKAESSYPFGRNTV